MKEKKNGKKKTIMIAAIVIAALLILAALFALVFLNREINRISFEGSGEEVPEIDPQYAAANGILFPTEETIHDPRIINVLFLGTDYRIENEERGRADSNILCSNMSDLKYWVNDDDDEEYMWFIYSGFGEFLSRVDSAAVLIHWNDGVTNPFIILDVRFLSTGCENDFLYAVTIDTVNHAPQKTHIVMKKGARILICEDATANAHYSWGYVNTETGAESEIPNSDYRYVQIPDGLNLDEYDFFVEVSYGKSPCRTRTYYRKDEQGDDWWSGNTDAPNLKVMPNPSNGDVAYSIDADIDGDYSVDVYNSVGKLVFSQNGNDFIRDTSVRIKKHLDPGIYLVSITTANGVLTQKIIVK